MEMVVRTVTRLNDVVVVVVTCRQSTARCAGCTTPTVAISKTRHYNSIVHTILRSGTPCSMDSSRLGARSYDATNDTPRRGGVSVHDIAARLLR